MAFEHDCAGYNVQAFCDSSKAGRSSPLESSSQGAGRFCQVRCNSVHQAWRETVVWFESELLQPTANSGHLFGRDAGLDHRRHEGSELGRGPAGFLEQLRMDEVKSVERMVLVLDSAIHMNAAARAGVPLDRGPRIHSLQLVRVLRDLQVVSRDDRDDGKLRSGRFPALRAPTRMIIGDRAFNFDFYRILRAFADECPAVEIGHTRFYSGIHRRMDVNGFGHPGLPHVRVLPNVLVVGGEPSRYCGGPHEP
jgi:hypothetical protein